MEVGPKPIGDTANFQSSFVHSKKDKVAIQGEAVLNTAKPDESITSLTGKKIEQKQAATDEKMTGVACTITSLKTSQLPRSQIGEQQFDEVVFSRDVILESDPTLVASERKFAEEVVKKLDTLDVHDVKAVVQAIETWDFTLPILQNKDLPYFILEALRRGLLDPVQGTHQVATTLNFWAALQYHQGPQDLKLIRFDSPEANEIFDETFKGYLKGDKREIFMKKMSQLPASEQAFLMVPDLQKNNVKSTFTVSQVIGNTLKVFNRVKSMRLVPSIGMMQAYLDAEFDEPVRIKPIIYLSTQKQIRENALKSTRDMMMPFPDNLGNNHCPPKADFLSAPWYDFPYHDFYHAVLASAVGALYREVGIVASDAVYGELAGVMIDMQYDRFLLEQKERSKIENFWMTIFDNFIDLQIAEKDQMIFLDTIYTAIIHKEGVSKEPTLIDLLLMRGTIVRNEKTMTSEFNAKTNAFNYTVKKGDCQFMKELLAKRPYRSDIRFKGAADAAENGNFEMVKLLIEGQKEDSIYFGRIVEAAANKGHLSIVEAYASKSSPAYLGLALISAAQENHSLIIEKLLSQPIPPEDIKEALRKAKRLNHQEVIQKLSSFSP